MRPLPLRPMLVIPVIAVVAGGLVLAIDTVPAAVASALAAMATSAAILALAGETPAVVVGAVAAPLLLVALVFSTRAAIPVAPMIAIAAAMWAVRELARPAAITLSAVALATPIVAAVIAGVLAPGCTMLVALIGWRFARTMPREDRRRTAILVVPVIGGVAVVLAVAAYVAQHGMFATLGRAWFGEVQPTSSASVAEHLGDTAGPLIAVAALAGAAAIARLHLVTLAVASCLAGTWWIELRHGGPPSVITVGWIAMLAGIAVARFAGMIRLASGQAVAGATCGLLLVLPPAWVAVERARVPIHGHSR